MPRYKYINIIDDTRRIVEYESSTQAEEALVGQYDLEIGFVLLSRNVGGTSNEDVPFNSVGLTFSDSPYSARYYDSINVSLNGSDVTITILDGTQEEQEIEINSVLLIGSNQLILQASNFEIVKQDGTVITDTELIINKNYNYNFKWSQTGWRHTIGK